MAKERHVVGQKQCKEVVSWNQKKFFQEIILSESHETKQCTTF